MKRFGVAVLFLLFSSFLQAQTVNFFTPEMDWSITSGLGFENGSDFAPLTTSVDISAELNMKEFYANFGNKFQPSQIDLTAEAVYWPTFWDCFNAGAGSIFHIVHYSKLFVEADILTGIYLGYHTPKKLDCMLNFLYHRKIARIYEIQDDVPWICNNSIAFKTLVNYRPVENLTLNLTISSYSPYRYMLFLAPDFSLSAEYRFFELFSAGAQLELQYIDMFTLSSNLNSIDVRIFGKLEF